MCQHRTVNATVLIIEEAPSLALAVAGLLEAEAIAVRTVPSFEEAERWVAAHRPSDRPVLVCASNAFLCRCLTPWRQGPLADSPLVLVGTRNPRLRSDGVLHVLSLPLRPDELVRTLSALVHGEPIDRSIGTELSPVRDRPRPGLPFPYPGVRR